MFQSCSDHSSSSPPAAAPTLVPSRAKDAEPEWGVLLEPETEGWALRQAALALAAALAFAEALEFAAAFFLALTASIDLAPALKAEP
jgi:hypothetical protein